MGLFNKLLGAGLGFTLGGGPIGAIIGFAFAAIYDETVDAMRKSGKGVHVSTPGDFIASLLVLVASVMKADGKVVKSELDYVKKYFIQSFGQSSASEAIKLLREILKKEIPVRDVCFQIKSRMDYSSRLQLLHFMYGIANADGKVDVTEEKLIDEIAYYLGISSADGTSIKNMFVKSTDWAYKVLEINKNISDEELKKAYRKMANKYHPDKVSYLGEELKAKANEKFAKINEAYEAVKKDRGIK